MSSDAEPRVAEPRVADPDEPHISLTVTTTMTKDYLARPLVNAVPGTSNATDFLGRAVTAGNKDFLARNLVA